jgi:putative transposase
VQQDLFTTEQIIAILQEAEAAGGGVAEISRRHNIATTTFYRWRQRFGGLPAGGARRDLERENARLKRLLAERDLEVDAIQGVAR